VVAAMAATLPRRRPVGPRGSATPRVAPPVPARSRGAELREQAKALGIDFFPWQDTAGRYLYALGRRERWLYPEVGLIVARQNGKTEILVPHIVKRLRMGRRIMHTAQNRELPREVFARVADAMEDTYPALLEKRPRFANGQEEILLRNGGKYRIVAPTRGGARGPSNDDVIVDEVRELDTHDFIAAAKPTLNASANPQILYLSNMGDDDSDVLNALIRRAGEDPALAYLEWSAPPEAEPDDVAGWLAANPAAGHMPQVLPNLTREHRSHLLAGTMAIFETEHLCRPVATLKPGLSNVTAWERWETPELEATPRRATLGLALDPAGTRASLAAAWPRPDGTIGLRLLYDVAGDPIDTDRLGKDMRNTARGLAAGVTGFDPLTDQALARSFTRTEPISAQKHANASAAFVSLLEAGRIRWEDAAAVGVDLEWTTRKGHEASGSFLAVRSREERPITAALAAIRAVWLASAPRPDPGTPRPSAVGF
jgi:hypothetical protein